MVAQSIRQRGACHVRSAGAGAGKFREVKGLDYRAVRKAPRSRNAGPAARRPPTAVPLEGIADRHLEHVADRRGSPRFPPRSARSAALLVGAVDATGAQERERHLVRRCLCSRQRRVRPAWSAHADVGALLDRAAPPAAAARGAPPRSRRPPVTVGPRVALDTRSSAAPPRRDDCPRDAARICGELPPLVRHFASTPGCASSSSTTPPRS